MEMFRTNFKLYIKIFYCILLLPLFYEFLIFTVNINTGILFSNNTISEKYYNLINWDNTGYYTHKYFCIYSINIFLIFMLKVFVFIIFRPIKWIFKKDIVKLNRFDALIIFLSFISICILFTLICRL